MTAEKLALATLRSLGFDVRIVEVGSQKTPDLLVSDGTCAYLVEIKDKFPDPSAEQQRTQALSAGAIWTEEQGIGYENVISGVIRHGAGQLASFQKEHVDFRLIWLHARHRYESLQLLQFESTLYGTVNLLDLAGAPVALPCFFFTYSEFFRFQGVLDGAFVASDYQGALCVNNLSARFEKLKSSQLCRAFPGFRDPIELERAGKAYIADCNMTRKDQTGVLEYVKAKYKRPRLIPFEPKRNSCETARS